MARHRDLADELAALQAQRAVANGVASRVTPAQARNVGELFRVYPSLGGAAVPLGTAGVTPDSPVAAKAARAGVAKRSRMIPAGAETTGSWMGKVWGAVKDEVLKPAVKYGMAGATFAIEAEMGVARTAIGAARSGNPGAFIAEQGSPGDILRQTTVGAGVAEAKERGQLAESFLPWGPDQQVSGDGWFIGPDSRAGKRQAREARTKGLIDGRAITIGRTVADVTGVDPEVKFNVPGVGQVGFNVMSGLVDATIGVVADPTTYVGGSLAKANRLRNVISTGPVADYAVPIKATQAGGTTPTMVAGRSGTQRVMVAQNAGLVDSIRPTVIPEKAIQWLDSEEAGNVVTSIANITPDDPEAFSKIWRGTNKKLPVGLVTQLVDETDPIMVKNLLVKAVEDGMREKVAFKTRRDWDQRARLFGMMPNTYINLDDMDDAVEQLDRFQRNIKLDEATVSRNNEKLARAGGNGERLEIVTSILDTVEDALNYQGIERSVAHEATRAFGDTFEDLRKYSVTATGDNANIPGVTIGANGRPLPKQHLSTEVLNGVIPLPNARNLKSLVRHMEVVRAVESHQGYKATRDVLDFFTNDIFKTFALAIRPAWTVRVVGEEQFRMGAAGLASAVHKPLSYIAWVAGERPTKLKTIYDDVLGADTQVEVASRLNQVMRGGRGGQDVLGQNFRDDLVAKGVTEFSQARNVGSSGWRNRIQIQSRHWTLYGREKKQYVESWQDELSQLMLAPEAVLVARQASLDDAKRIFWQADNFKKMRDDMKAADPESNIDTRAGADEFLDSVAERISTKTQGHPDLLDVIRTGKLRGHALFHGTQPNKAARKILQEMNEANMGPDVVKGRLVSEDIAGGVQKMAEVYDNAAEFMFNALGAVPTNRLSRSPVFRQQYWNRVEELSGLLNKADRIALARQAKAAGMDRKMVARLRATADGPTPEGKLTLEEMDQVAKAYGLVETRKLLYSLHEKSQMADAFRVVFPFGEAWREVLTRWTKLGVNPSTMNPLVPYRTAQGLSNGEGVFFAPDPVTGEEMVHIPGSKWITEKFAGVPVQLDMPLKGMNMFGNIIPGSGPVITMGASQLLPDDPDWDMVRDLILPYGETDTSSGLLESQLPSYAKKIIAGLGFTPFGIAEANKKQIASTTRDVAAYLNSTGDYDLSTPDGQDRLLQDARSKAQRVYLIRAVAQSTLPASPSTRFFAKDKNGNLATIFKLAEDYRRMQDDDFTTATERFISKYGDLAFLSVIGKSEGSVAPTDTVNMLARDNPAVARKFPTTFGYFAAPSDEVDPAEIERQVETGTRNLVEGEAAIRAANIRVAASIYAQALKKTGDTQDTEETAWLREVRDRLKRDYRGYTGGFDSTKSEGTMQELVLAAKDPVLSKTPVGEALGVYLRARAQATREARDNLGVAGFQDSQAARPLRDWLRGVAGKLSADYPGFSDVYDRVLSREMTEDDDG